MQSSSPKPLTPSLRVTPPPQPSLYRQEPSPFAPNYNLPAPPQITSNYSPLHQSKKLSPTPRQNYSNIYESTQSGRVEAPKSHMYPVSSTNLTQSKRLPDKIPAFVGIPPSSPTQKESYPLQKYEQSLGASRSRQNSTNTVTDLTLSRKVQSQGPCLSADQNSALGHKLYQDKALNPGIRNHDTLSKAQEYYHSYLPPKGIASPPKAPTPFSPKNSPLKPNQGMAHPYLRPPASTSPEFMKSSRIWETDPSPTRSFYSGHSPIQSKKNTESNGNFKKKLIETTSSHSTVNSLTEIASQSPKKLDKPALRGPKSANTFQIDDFVLGAQLGSGKFGKVHMARHRNTGFLCALKAIPKQMVKGENIANQLARQIKIQSCLDHPNVTKLYGWFDDTKHVYLLLQLASSGQLYKVLKEKQRFNQQTTSYIVKQVCEAVRYLHTFKIIHRDIKPENIVMQHSIVKLCDFGWAVCRGSELRSTFCGTPLYVSPEILKGQNYDQKIDLWAVGILTYELLFGDIPFSINSEEELVRIIKEDITFPTNPKVSDEAKDFILSILKKNPDQRLRVSQLLEHPFLNNLRQSTVDIDI